MKSVDEDTTFDVSRIEKTTRRSKTPKMSIIHRDYRKVLPAGMSTCTLEFIRKKQFRIDMTNAALALASIMIVYYEVISI